VFAIRHTNRRQLEEEVLAGVGRLAAVADAAAGRAADAELEAAAAARRAAWVQAVDALTAQKAAGQVRPARRWVYVVELRHLLLGSLCSGKPSAGMLRYIVLSHLGHDG
jgi:hypothetical protein